MIHNFDEVIERRNTRSVKWDTYPPDVLPMWIADSDFRAPQPVVDAIAETARHGVFGYTSADGAFEEAYAGWATTRLGWRIPADRVRWCPSIGTALAVSILTFTRPGEGVCMLLPTYPPFLHLCRINGREVRGTALRDTNGRYEIDFADLERQLARRDTRLLLLCNPHNPTGRVLSEQELRRIGELCLKHNVIIFSDEIHCDIIFRGRHIPLPTISPDIARITLVGLNASKTFNLADLRSGAVLSESDNLLETFAAELDRVKVGRCSLGIAGVIAAYTRCADYADRLLLYLRGNMAFAEAFFTRELVPLKTRIPEATFMLWIDCRALGFDQDELKRFFVERAKVALNSGTDFGDGGEGFMRMNLACPRVVLAEGLQRIRAALRAEGF